MSNQKKNPQKEKARKERAKAKVLAERQKLRDSRKARKFEGALYRAFNTKTDMSQEEIKSRLAKNMKVLEALNEIEEERLRQAKLQTESAKASISKEETTENNIPENNS